MHGDAAFAHFHQHDKRDHRDHHRQHNGQLNRTPFTRDEYIGVALANG
jgi:hypothetical protein